MTMAMDEVLTAGEVSRMTGIPVSTLHDWAAKRERGIESPGPHHCKLSSRHRRWMRAGCRAMACRIEVLNGDDSQARSQVRHAMGR
jgi:hypothetical protein